MAFVLTSLPAARCAFAKVVILAWDANTDTGLSGYKVYYGTSSGVYGAPLDAGNVTLYTVTGLAPGTYYFAVTAYNQAGAESPFSNEVSTTIGAADTTAPTISVTSPAANGVYQTSNPTLTIAGSSADDVGVTAVVWADSAGGSGLATGTTNWSATVSLTSGINRITIMAKDAAGNATSTTFIANLKPSPLAGDLNGDGKIDGADVQILAGVLLGGKCPSQCDINGDGKVDVLDLQRLADLILSPGSIP